MSSWDDDVTSCMSWTLVVSLWWGDRSPSPPLFLHKPETQTTCLTLTICQMFQPVFIVGTSSHRQKRSVPHHLWRVEQRRWDSHLEEFLPSSSQFGWCCNRLCFHWMFADQSHDAFSCSAEDKHYVTDLQGREQRFPLLVVVQNNISITSPFPFTGTSALAPEVGSACQEPVCLSAWAG